MWSLVNRREPFCLLKRVRFVLLSGFLFFGMVGNGATLWASSFDPSEKADLLELNMAGHELVQMARSDAAGAQRKVSGQETSENEPSEEGTESEAWREDEFPDDAAIPDPLEPMNRAFFAFNDAAYFWFFKPVAQGYSTVMPEVMRVSFRNFFTNLSMPIRLLSSLLQGKVEKAGIILVRFMVNSTAGFLGFQDVARQALDYPLQDEDLGQAFAFYGIGHGFYLNLPFLGASSLRDTAGWVGGLFVNPLDYILEDWIPNLSARGLNIVNNTSLRVGEYEALKEASLDPYVAMRDAYFQYRKNLVEK